MLYRWSDYETCVELIFILCKFLWPADLWWWYLLAPINSLFPFWNSMASRRLLILLFIFLILPYYELSPIPRCYSPTKAISLFSLGAEVLLFAVAYRFNLLLAEFVYISFSFLAAAVDYSSTTAPPPKLKFYLNFELA